MENSEAEKLKAKIEQLEAENERLQKELDAAKTTIKRAKNPNPWDKPSFRTVVRLANECCMNIKKLKSGWLLVMGALERKFKSLKQIWELLSQESFVLSEIFNPPRLNTAARPRLPRRFPILAGYGVAVQRSEQTAEEIPHVPFADEGFEAYSYANSS